MARNKVIYNGVTLIDLTTTTATAEQIMQGYGCFGADGEWIDGTATGGGGGSITATINVSYAGPLANVSAISDSASAGSPADSDGSAVITITKPGTYTVSSSQKGQTRTIVITASGTYYCDFRLVLYDNGDTCSAVTGGWVGKAYKIASGSSSGGFNVDTTNNYLRIYGSTSTTQRSYGGKPTNAIDVTGYSKLCAIVRAGASNDNIFHLAIMPTNQTSTTYAVATTSKTANTFGTTNTQVTLDFSANGTYDIALIAQRKSNTTYFYVTKVWLE